MLGNIGKVASDVAKSSESTSGGGDIVKKMMEAFQEALQQAKGDPSPQSQQT
jgi:hypothetical protein